MASSRITEPNDSSRSVSNISRALQMVTSHATEPKGDSNVGRIHTIYAPPTGIQPTHPLDIIAIHGESGDWDRSWRDRQTNYSWLEDALPREFPDARVISCGHRGSRERVVENLIWDIIDDRTAKSRQDIPIIIIAHSLGGSIAKQLFVASAPIRTTREEAKTFHDCIKGFMLFGTLNRGSYDRTLLKTVKTWNNAMGAALRSLPLADRNPHSELPQFLKRVPQINDDFRLSGGEEVPAVCFFEENPSNIALQKLLIVSEASASLPHAENRGLDATHLELIRFPDRTSGSLLRVLGSLHRLINQALKWQGVPGRALTAEDRMKPGTKILSLDGGGVKGLFSALVLEALMEEVRKIDAPDNPDALKPCNYFDMICGTSTGGLLAIMLGRLRMDVRSCIRSYRDISQQIFQRSRWSFPGRDLWDGYWGNPRYSGESLEVNIKSILREHLSRQECAVLHSQNIKIEDAPLCPLPDSDQPQAFSHTKCFVCAIIEGQRGCDRLRSYESARDAGKTSNTRAENPTPLVPKFTIWQAGRATSAAPFYFPPIIISGRRYFDGGMESNNPVLEAYMEGVQEFPNREFAAIVSIGTGSTSAPAAVGTGFMSFFYGLIDRVTDTELPHTQFSLLYPGLANKYFRLQETQGLGAIDLADWQKLDVIEQKAHAYLADEEVMDKIRNCARKLARNEGQDINSAPAAGNTEEPRAAL